MTVKNVDRFLRLPYFHSQFARQVELSLIINLLYVLVTYNVASVPFFNTRLYRMKLNESERKVSMDSVEWKFDTSLYYISRSNKYTITNLNRLDSILPHFFFFFQFNNESRVVENYTVLNKLLDILLTVC